MRGLLKKLLKHADIQLHWAVNPKSDMRVTVHGLKLKRKKKRKHNEDLPLQQGYYGPVWAVLMYEASGVGALTSPKRERVKNLIREMQRVAEDSDEQRVIAGEHILQKGPYTAACKALIGRTMR